MKRIMSAALAASLFAGTAIAQPPERGQRGDGAQRQGPADWGGRGGSREDRQQSPRQARPEPQARPAPQAQPAPQQQRQERPQAQRGERNNDNRGPGNRGPDNRGPDRNDRGPDRGDRWQGNRGPDNRFDNRGPGQQQYNRGPGRQQFRDRDRGRPQFDQRRYRPSYRAPQRFRIAPYRAPPGFYNRSWSYGDRLPFGWFGSSYYLNFSSYGLPYPPIGAEWVRVGSDALLVDIWSGQVLSVYYGLFW